MKSFKNSAFARFFTNFPKIMFANLLYTIPSTICFAIFGLIGYLTGFQNVIVWFLGIIPAYPLYAGLVMVIRKIAIEKEDINVLDTFKTSVRGNWKTFLINGIITYLIVHFQFSQFFTTIQWLLSVQFTVHCLHYTYSLVQC